MLRFLRPFHGNILHSVLPMPNSCQSLEKRPAFPLFFLGSSHRFIHFHGNPLRNAAKFNLFSTKSPGYGYCEQLSFSSSSEGIVTERLKKLHGKLSELGIMSVPNQSGQKPHDNCPQCKGGNINEKSLSLYIDENGMKAMWKCFRATCGWQGCVVADWNKGEYIVLPTLNSGTSKKKYRAIVEEDLRLGPLCPALIDYFNARCISSETLRRNAVMQQIYGDEVVIAFTYRRNGQLITCNYLNIENKFWQEKDTERIFYGIDDLEPEKEIIIVESELDKLSMEEAGYRNCLSVPNGRVLDVSKKLSNENEDTSFEYLSQCKDLFEKVPRIIIATNADALADELACRLGKERCWRAKWPMKSDTEVCKDANEVLSIFGEIFLKEVIKKAEIYPIRGLFSFSNFISEINTYYTCSIESELGASTGWTALDDLYNIVPGELTVITGVPNSGKSEWLDALMCNLNASHGWKFALCSMENTIEEHARKLLEKYIKKPFFNIRYGESVERMSVLELEEGKKWLSDTFFVIKSDNLSIDRILELAKGADSRHRVHGLVIDPYNELHRQSYHHLTETEYVSRALSTIKRFASMHSCHVWLVAHPRKLQNWRGDPPSLYDISGSAHFINKCDNGIVIHRDTIENVLLDHVSVSVMKVRNKVAGRVGDALLAYDRITGLFHDINNQTSLG